MMVTICASTDSQAGCLPRHPQSQNSYKYIIFCFYIIPGGPRPFWISDGLSTNVASSLSPQAPASWLMLMLMCVRVHVCTHMSPYFIFFVCKYDRYPIAPHVPFPPPPPRFDWLGTYVWFSFAPLQNLFIM